MRLINEKSEGEYWDYKQEWHKDNERLIHDILCFANTIHNKDCYIIIGVSDNGEIIGLSENNRMKQVFLLDMLSNYNFAGDNVPDVCVDTINLNGKEIDVVTIYNSFQVPYFLKNRSKRYNFLREGYIYTRIGDKNTPISENANIQQIEMLWKKRLGLTLPPLEQIISRLKNKSEWIENEGTHYNMYRPEFMLVETYDDDEYDRLNCEFYVYSQTNSNFKYKSLKIMFNQTILKEFQLVLLDSRVFKTPIPQWGNVGYDEYGVNHKYTYKYYLKDGIDYQLQQYYFDAENMEEIHAKRKFDEVILYYDNDDERKCFEFFVENKQNIVEQYITEAEEVYYEIDCGNEKAKKDERHRLSTGIALNKLLKEFREIINES